MSRGAWLFVLVTGVGVVAPLDAAAEAAAISPSAAGSTVLACVNSKGAMRISATKRCRSRERRLTLLKAPAQAGPRGPAGPQGVPGPQGAPGPQGSADTPQDLLGKLLTVDGAASGLDAGLLGGFPPAAYQRRGDVTACPAGEVTRAILASGDLTCVADKDTNTTYAAGMGLTMTGTTLSTAVMPAARLTRASSPTIFNSARQSVRWSTLEYEQGGDLYRGTLGSDCSVPAACRLYAPIAGIYDIDAGVAWADADDSAGSRYTEIVHYQGTSDTARTLAAVQEPTILGHVAWGQQIVSTQMRLAAGDSVAVRVEAYTTEPNTSLQENQDRTFLALRWAGPAG